MPYIADVPPVLVADSHEAYRHLLPVQHGDGRRKVVTAPEVLVHPTFAAAYESRRRARRTTD